MRRGACATRTTRAVPATGGFTLVEVMVALAVMALLALMTWRAVDGMQRTQEATRSYSDGVLALQAGLAQWGADLDAVTQVPPVGGLEFDGRVLRLTRLDAYAAPPGDAAEPGVWSGGSLRVVAWTLRVVDGRRRWLRWQSPPLRQRIELLAAWQMAQQWGQSPDDAMRAAEVEVADADDWRIFYFRDNAWTSPLSSADAGALGTAAGQTALPDGVRLELQLGGTGAIAGALTRDWVRPTIGPGGA
jgi:general secretion pathway protein J